MTVPSTNISGPRSPTSRSWDRMCYQSRSSRAVGSESPEVSLPSTVRARPRPPGRSVSRRSSSTASYGPGGPRVPRRRPSGPSGGRALPVGTREPTSPARALDSRGDRGGAPSRTGRDRAVRNFPRAPDLRGPRAEGGTGDADPAPAPSPPLSPPRAAADPAPGP